MNDQKSQTGKRAQVNAKQPWYITALQSIGVDLSGLTKRQITELATRKLGRSKHAGGHKRSMPRRALFGRSDRHLRIMGR